LDETFWDVAAALEMFATLLEEKVCTEFSDGGDADGEIDEETEVVALGLRTDVLTSLLKLDVEGDEDNDAFEPEEALSDVIRKDDIELLLNEFELFPSFGLDALDDTLEF
jgi:hypothetical protein